MTWFNLVCFLYGGIGGAFAAKWEAENQLEFNRMHPLGWLIVIVGIFILWLPITVYLAICATVVYFFKIG
jgi:hypothetical protein